MAIEKNTKNTLQHEDFPFTIINNEVINNIQHTGALGVYCYLSSKNSGWEICKKHLQNHFGCGREHIETCFKYLKKIGAIEISMIRDEKGKSIGWNTLLKRKLPQYAQDEIQNTGNPLSGDLSRIRETQNLGNPESGKSAPINKRYIEIKDNINIKPIVDSHESPQMVYNSQSDIVDLYLEEKSDYPNNHEVEQNDGQIVQAQKGKPKRSDYFENQNKNESTGKSKSQYDLKELQNENIFQIPEQMIQDWIETRKKKRAPITKTAWNKINKELAKCKEQGIEPIEAFETMVASGWQSLKPEYFHSHETKSKHELSKKRSIELEEMAKKRKQREIDDAKRLKHVVSKSSEKQRQKLREIIGSKAPGDKNANT